MHHFYIAVSQILFLGGVCAQFPYSPDNNNNQPQPADIKCAPSAGKKSNHNIDWTAVRNFMNGQCLAKGEHKIWPRQGFDETYDVPNSSDKVRINIGDLQDSVPCTDFFNPGDLQRFETTCGMDNNKTNPDWFFSGGTMNHTVASDNPQNYMSGQMNVTVTVPTPGV